MPAVLRRNGLNETHSTVLFPQRTDDTSRNLDLQARDVERDMSLHATPTAHIHGHLECAANRLAIAPHAKILSHAKSPQHTSIASTPHLVIIIRDTHTVPAGI